MERPESQHLPPGSDLERDWPQLPCMTREDLARQIGAVMPDDSDLTDLWVYSTSGTTGLLSSGLIQLVTPNLIHSKTQFSDYRTWGIFGELTLRFVPEPGVGVMLVAGAVALILLGRHRVR